MNEQKVLEQLGEALERLDSLFRSGGVFRQGINNAFQNMGGLVAARTKIKKCLGEKSHTFAMQEIIDK